MTTDLIFEPHNGFGGHDPYGMPWPFGYISEGPGQPIFELSTITEQSPDELRELALKMAAAPALLDALDAALNEGPLYAWANEKNIGREEYERRVAIVAAARAALARIGQGEPSK